MDLTGHVEKRRILLQEFLITLDIMLPLLLMLGVGWLLRRIGLMTDAMTPGMNQLVFRVFLPVLLFNNIRTLDLEHAPGLAFSVFIVASVFGIWLIAQLLMPRFFHDPKKVGVMVQGVFRSNFAVLGIPLMQSMFGSTGLAAVTLGLPLVIPLNNVLGVIALSSAGGKADFRSVFKKIITNPMIIGALLGALMLPLDWTVPAVVDEVCNDLAALASPISLLVLGASLKWQGVRDNRRELVVTVLLKQLIVPFAMVGLAVLLGFRHEELGVMVILFGAPVAVSSYPMAEAMGCDGPLAASLLVLTTVFSMGTLFALIYLGKLLGVL